MARSTVMLAAALAIALVLPLVAVQQLAKMIGEFKRRYHERWDGTEGGYRGQCGFKLDAR